MRKLQFWGWLFFLLFIVASPVSAETPQPVTDPLLMTPDYTGLNVHLANYYWDPEGILGQYNMAYILGNGLLYSSVAFVRLSTWLLNLGYMPSQWLTPIQQIADAIQKNQLIHRIWPILPVIAAGVLFKDFFKHQYQRAVQRAILFGLVSLALILFQGLGTAKYLSSTTEAIDAVSYGVSGWILGASKPDSNTSGDKAFEQRTNDIDKEIWTRLVQDPWEMGEIGTPGTKIEAKDIREVNNQISNGDGGITGFILKHLGLPSSWDTSIVDGKIPWSEVILRYPEGSGARNGLAGILNSDDHPESKAAFNPYYRALLGFIMILGASGVALYNVVMGALLLGAHVLFIVAVTAGIVILPCCLIPWGYSESMLQWWIKMLAGSIFIKIALSAYVGATFFVIEIFSPAATTQTTGHSLAYMILYPIWFVAALWILIRIQKKWRPLQRMTGVNLPGVNRFFPSSQRGEKNSSGRHTTAAQRRNPEQLQDQQTAQPNEPETSSQPGETTDETAEARTSRNQAAAPRTNPERAGMSAASVQDIEHPENGDRRRETPNPTANRDQTAALPTQERNRMSASRHEGTEPANTQETSSTRNPEIEGTTSSQERNRPRRQQREPGGVLEEERGTNPISADPEQGFSQIAPHELQPQESRVSSLSPVENEAPTWREDEGEFTEEEEGEWNQAESDSPYKINDYRSFGQEETNLPFHPSTELADKPSLLSHRDKLLSEEAPVKRSSAEKIDLGAAQHLGDPDQAQTSWAQAEIQAIPPTDTEGLKEQAENRGRQSKPSLDPTPAQGIEKTEQNPNVNSTQQILKESDDAPPIPSRKERLARREKGRPPSHLDEEVSAAVRKEPQKKSRSKIKLPTNVETAASKIKSDAPQYL